jgi:hypothetical protein
VPASRQPVTTPHGPRTHLEVLAVAAAEMAGEDEAAERVVTMQDAVQLWLQGKPTGLKRPRRELRRYIRERKGRR